MILAVDFDRTIHDTDHPGASPLGPPIPEAAETLRRLKARGHKIIIHTCRATSTSGTVMVRRWCAQHHVPFDDITAVKPNADLFIDDRAVTFTTWPDMFHLLTARPGAGQPSED